MKKRKTYEISVIDRTHSKTISDETKFYTSDTALELEFKLKETDYNFESAEIVLLNIDDRSLTTRPVSKVNNDFVYELDDDIIPLYGEWHGQLRFEAGETYVSSPVKFRIENDLSNDRPPQLSDVQSWVSLKRYADSLTEELKQAVLDVGGIGDTFNENETDRQNTFETNESERSATFNTNEDIRQTQELEREGAEATRKTVFDDNEASRFDTFNANETTRQTNETTRQQAESQRQSTFETNETERQTTFETAELTREQSEIQRASAESIRVSAEEQRKIEHESRSAELDGKADKVVLKNLVTNGDFSDGSVGWKAYNGGTVEVVDSRLKVDVSTNNYAGTRQDINARREVGDVIYTNVSVENPNSHDITLNFQHVMRTNLVRISPTFNGGVSTVQTVDSSASVFIYYLTKDNTSAEYSFYIDNVILLNLTNIFGTGNEPTKDEMDSLIEITGYIDKEYALNNKEMLIWTLALIRRNKNAIVALGGA